MAALEQDRAGVVAHRLAHHRGADDLRLADLLDPPRGTSRRRGAGEQLRRQGAQLSVVELRDRRERNRSAGIAEGRQLGDQRLAEQQRGIDFDGVRERQPMPPLAKGAEQVRRPRLGVKRRVDLRSRPGNHPRDPDLLRNRPASRLPALTLRHPSRMAAGPASSSAATQGPKR